ncbi:MAG: PAS domain S-box protein, partial [Sneathiella sp.]
KIDRYSTEQIFVDGHTIRLTHYRTPSGNTVAVRTDITELVESRQKAEENEAWIRHLLEGSPTPLLISVDGIYRYASSSAHELFEIPDDSLAGKHTSDFYHDLTDRKKLLAQLDVDGVVSRMKMDIRTFKGNRKTVLSSNTRINYRGENAIFASILDITEAEATALALRRSERQNRDLLELVPDALVVQVNGKIVYVNDSAVRIFKSDNKSNMIGTPSIDIIHKDERARIMNLRQAVMSGRSPTVILTRHSRFDGGIFHSEMYSKVVTWDGNIGTMNIIKDMSKRRSYEATLIQKEKEMSLAQEIGHLGHWRIKLDDLTVVWSDELYRIHGLDPLKDQIDMDQAVKFVDPRDRQTMIDTVYKTADTQETQVFTIRINLSEGGCKTMMGSMRAEFDEEGAVASVFGVSQDITDRLTLEDKLRQSQKMEAIGQLTGGVAHDFNNLLAVIQGNAELLLDLSQTLSKTEHDQLKAIMRASHRGAMLTKSMLAFSRKQELRPTPTYLDRQVESITNMLARTLGEAIDIQISSDPDLWPCIADSSQVESAILNLALNARDAMPGGGLLVISCKNTYLDETAAAPTENLKAGNYVMLSVQDNGSGIAPDDIQHVFEPFYTTKEVGKGTGLGLSMVYGFVKQSEGHITIQSRPSEGTTVRIYLPQSDLPAPLYKEEQAGPRVINHHILLVEDDPAMRELSASLLTAMGATLQEAGTGQEALKILEKKDGKFDLLLTDVMLPGGMSGPSISREARRLYPKLKTLFMSGYTEDPLTNDEGEKIPLIQKPFKRAELAAKIASTLSEIEATR